MHIVMLITGSMNSYFLAETLPEFIPDRFLPYNHLTLGFQPSHVYTYYHYCTNAVILGK